MTVHCYLFGMTNGGSIVEIDPKQTSYRTSPKQHLGTVSIQRGGEIMEITTEVYDIHEFDIGGTPRFIGFPQGTSLQHGFDWLLTMGRQKQELGHVKSACRFIGEKL